MEASDHQLRAAIRVARILDEGWTSSEETGLTFPLVVSQGEHRADDLLAGQGILARIGLVRVESDRSVATTPTLVALAKLPDEEALQCLRLLFSRRFDEDRRIAVGLAGEVAVLEVCRADLASLGHPELMPAVYQVSLLDDSLGYDVVAPMIGGSMRWLEVKTSTRPREGVFEFFLTRNEYEVGRREPTFWALVACTLEGRSGSPIVVGWCRAATLQPYLPDDGNGRWTEALVQVPCSVLFEGIPRAV